MVELIVFITNLGIFNIIASSLLLCSFVITFYQVFCSRGKIAVGMVKKSSFLLLCLFGLVFILLYQYSMENLILYVVLPILSYVSGWSLLSSVKRPVEKAKTVIFAIVLASIVHTLLNVQANIGLSTRIVVDFFSGQERAATVEGAINTIVMALLGFFIITKNKIIKCFGIICVMIASAYSLLIGTRTQLIIMILTFALVLFLYVNEVSEKRGGIKAVLIISVLVLICVITYEVNLFGVADRLEKTNLFIRLASSTTRESDINRIERLQKGIKFVFSHLFGGDKSELYFHNMWLDIGRLTGLIPAIIMLIYNVIVTKHTISIFKMQSIDFEMRYLMLCLTVGVLLNFCVEPILEGLPELYLKFCLINGMSEYIYYYPHDFEQKYKV